MITTNPLPGMNPLLEAEWVNAHTKLMSYIGDELVDGLPSDLRVLVEEEIEIGHEPPLTRYRPDVAIREEFVRSMVPEWSGDAVAVAVAEPHIIEVDPLPHRWVEIRDVSDTLITVIEVLSPTNKIGQGRQEYLDKQHNLLSAGVNLVEIDLVRVGKSPWPENVLSQLRSAEGTRYLMISSRATQPTQREVYYCPLRDPLPTIRIPLRATDADVTLALQPLIDRVYRTGRYWQIAGRGIPAPELPPDESQWIAECWKEAAE